MPRCRYHPETEADAVCAHCQFPHCPSCLVEFLGQAHCKNCRDARLTLMQRDARRRPPPQIVRARWLLIWVFVSLIGAVSILSAIVSQFPSGAKILNGPGMTPVTFGLVGLLAVTGVMILALMIVEWVASRG